MRIFTAKALNKNGGGGASGPLRPIDAEYWVGIANREEPKRLLMTDWYAGNTAPKRKGFYQRYYTDGLYYDFWDGRQWLQRNDRGQPHWRQVGSYVAWRGLTYKGYVKAIINIFEERT